MREYWLSALFHFGLLGVIGIAHTALENKNAIFSLSTQKGTNQQSFKNQKKTFYLGASDPKTNISEPQSGNLTPETEVEEWKKKLSYPDLALELNLEDSCSFRLFVDEKGLIEKVESERACKYSVFTDQFLQESSLWHFKTISNQVVNLPVLYKLDGRTNTQ